MKFRFILFLVIALGMAWCIAPPKAEALEEPCETEHERWSVSSANLRAALEQYGQIKEQSMASEITESLGRQNTGSMARIVQSALKQRSEILAAAEAKCLKLANDEKYAFEALRRCVSTPQQRRNSSLAATLATISRDRERLLKHLQDLLLDEAYVQYKGERENSARANSDYGQDQAPRMTYQQWGPNSGTDRRWSGGYPNAQNPYGYYSR
ncbi:MAG: hypothetical protein HY913_03480 [Desulfomonile tiedjei]|nr:hypothetical protein [Desulfomonile tiedjei]